MVYTEKEKNFVCVHYFYNDTNDPSIVTDDSSKVFSSMYLYTEHCLSVYVWGIDIHEDEIPIYVKILIYFKKWSCSSSNFCLPILFSIDLNIYTLSLLKECEHLHPRNKKDRNGWNKIRPHRFQIMVSEQ